MKYFILLSSLIILFGACEKDKNKSLIVKGRVLAEYNNEAVTNIPVTISYIHPTTGMGFNLANRSNISKSTTDKDGNFTVITPYPMAKDTNDYYKIEALSSDSYFGFSESINALKAESERDIYLGDIKVDKIIRLNLTISHLGVPNNTDNISGDVDHATFLEYGSEPIIKKKYLIAYNKPIVINWRTKKNNVYSAPFSDTLKYTNPTNEYTISY